jgi:hypothetical protein
MYSVRHLMGKSLIVLGSRVAISQIVFRSSRQRCGKSLKVLEEVVGERLRGLARGKKRLDVVHYEIVGKTGEAMIVGVKSQTGEKKAVMVKRDVETGSKL